MERYRRWLPPRPAAFLLVFLAALLVVFGAATLPAMTHHSPPGLVLPVPDAGPTATPTPGPTPAEAPGDTRSGPGRETIGRLGQAIAAALFAVVLLFIVGLALSLRRRDRAADVMSAGGADDVPSEARLRGEVASALLRAEASLDGAAGAEIRSRIIAAWAGLERLAALRGHGRRGHQTPTEHAGALLAAFGVSAAPLGRLLALYERVRYDAGAPGWEPDPAQVRHAAADFAQLAGEVEAAGRAHGARRDSVGT